MLNNIPTFTQSNVHTFNFKYTIHTCNMNTEYERNEKEEEKKAKTNKKVKREKTQYNVTLFSYIFNSLNINPITTYKYVNVLQ